MPSYAKFAAAALAAMVPLASAQTYTDCNPLHKSCPNDPGLKKAHFDADFSQGKSALSGFETTAGQINFGNNGAEFTVAQQGDAPTIQSNFYIFFGRVDVKMRIAPGQGIVSSIVLESDDLDEIDWEGLGSYDYEIETNYFGKGDTTTYDRATYEKVPTPVETWHTYSIDWTKEAINFLVDGKSVRTLAYQDAKGGSRFPQTPMRLRIGIWAGGDPNNGKGTIEWAGGKTDYSKAPFTMYVDSVHIDNYNPAGEYKWTDQSGSYQSIKAIDAAPGADHSSVPPAGNSDSTKTSDMTMTATGSGSTKTTAAGSKTTAGSGSGSSEGTKTSGMMTTTTGAGSSSMATSTNGSSSSAGSGSGSKSSSGSGMGSGSGPSSSTTGMGSGSGSGSGSSSSAGASSATPSVTTGSAATLAAGPLAFVGLLTALLQL